MTISPYPYQKETIEKFTHVPAVLDGSEMGLSRHR